MRSLFVLLVALAMMCSVFGMLHINMTDYDSSDSSYDTDSPEYYYPTSEEDYHEFVESILATPRPTSSEEDREAYRQIRLAMESNSTVPPKARY